ncbi:3-hydroxyacyl-ACP dehydratase [Halodesulfovibrio sp.]|uniref:ApeP family dehydratase n=1 Tax=Halodesulfovibrio sp. TaxID=1912772 RepID=UPI0025BD4805|nr:3-hydroxyacyl-ACP dehydratase [Halodesulfovibrio sp.]
MSSLPLDVAGILPHKPPMRLVDRLVHVEDEQAVVTARLDEDCILVGRNAELDSVVYAELVAQAYAAFKGYQLAQANEDIKEGYLVGIRKMKVLGKAVAGDSLTVTVTTVGLLQGFAVVDGTVAHGERLIAEVRLKLYVPEEGGLEV